MTGLVVGSFMNAIFFVLTGRWLYGYWFWEDGK